MKKYAIPACFMLLGNEVISLMALTVIACIFVVELMKGAPTP